MKDCRTKISSQNGWILPSEKIFSVGLALMLGLRFAQQKCNPNSLLQLQRGCLEAITASWSLPPG